jgi:uncharacterized damage-inducible protein DinB
VTDLKPPRLVSDERQTLQALLQYQRESLVRKVDGVDEGAASRQFIHSGTTLLWLMKHIAHAETLWIVQRFLGQDAKLDDAVNADDTIAAAIDAYRHTWARVDAVVSAASLDDRCRGLAASEAPANLRWVLMHLLEEAARHAGHADIIRELIDGSTGR